MLPSVAEPVLERDTALANFQSTQYGFALGLDVKKVTLLTFDEFFERLERDAPNAMLFLDRSTHEKSGCATLRFNQPGSKTT